MQEYGIETHFSDYLKVIKRRKGVIIVFFLITVAIVTVVSFLMEPVYRATVTLLIDMESPPVLMTASNADSVALGYTDYRAYKEYFQSQKEIIKSRSIARLVFKQSKLNQIKDYLQAEDSIKSFLNTVEAEPIRDTRLLLLHVNHKNPKDAAELANRIADIYVTRNLSYITKSETLNLLKNEYLKFQAKLSEYSKIYKHKHPKMIRLKKEIKQIASKIEQEKRDSVSNSEGSLFLRGQKANNISIEDRAEPPLKTLLPKKRLNILLSMLVGLFGGLSLAFFFEYLDNTVKEGEEVERIVKWPVLGNIPRINGVARDPSGINRNLFVLFNPRDPISEAYRAIRTSLLFSSTPEHPFKSIFLTSPGPQEGKTTTICNLGIIIAQNRNRVLLVDADMRKSRLHEIFKIKNAVGLSNFLSGQADFNMLVQKTEISSLYFVPSGHYPPNPSELLAGRRMKEFIEIAKERFDFILFDTPPMAVVTDAVILSRIVDGGIIVLESGKTNRRELPRLNKILKDARARIIGALLNKISQSNSSYSHYAYYYRKTK